MKTLRMRYGKTGMDLVVPDRATVLGGHQVPPLTDPAAAVRAALSSPIGSAPLAGLLAARKPATVAITVSDATRPVPNREFLPALLDVILAAGIDDSRIVVIIGTGMHRPSTESERERLIGRAILGRIEVIDHRADDPRTLVRVSDQPPISVCRRFAEADFRVVTGFIEPHFMAGFSGGRKGVCPALVDLETIRRFHGYETLANPAADNGRLDGNPCHDIALAAARTVGVDFLFNVVITSDGRMAAIYAGDLEQAHTAGCRQVAEWTRARVDGPFDLVITSGGGFPLDQTFYQTVKGMCAALPTLAGGSTLLQVSACAEQVGSNAYATLMWDYDNDWQAFLKDIAARRHETRLDQWAYQMQARVLARIGRDKLWFVSDGIPAHIQQRLSVHPILGPAPAGARAQAAIDGYLHEHPGARVAVIPDGPYTLPQPAP